MKVLTIGNEPFELNQVVPNMDDLYYSVIDASDINEPDYMFHKLHIFTSYEHPSVELQIGDFTVEVPLNWKILTGHPDEGVLELVSIEDLLGFDYKAFVTNPLHGIIPNYMDIKVNKAYPTNTRWFVPKLQKKNMLAVPVGTEADWKEYVIDRTTGETHKAPLCVYFIDDIDTMKNNIETYDLIN